MSLAALAIVFACVGNHLRRLQAQERAFEQIAQRGGMIYVYDEGVYIHFKGPLPTCGTGLKRTIAPAGSPRQFTDVDLVHLRSVIKLLSVDLGGTNVSPAAFARLQTELTDCYLTM